MIIRRKKKKNLLRNMVAAAILLCLLPLIPISYMQAKQIRLNKTSLTLAAGEQYGLKLYNGRKTVFKSKDKKIAKVTDRGKVTAVSPGNTEITATYKGKKYKCHINVVQMNKTKKTLKKGSSFQLKVKGAEGRVSWSSSNKKVAVVDSNGKVTARSEGNATITAKTSGKKMYSTISVKEDKKENTDGTKKNDSFEISFIDVGQADAILIQDNGTNTLIDCGNKDDKDTLTGYLKEKGVKTLDKVFLTHWHEDHIGSFQYLPGSFNIKQVYVRENVNDINTEVYNDTLEAIEHYGIKKNVQVHGETIGLGKAAVQIVGPINAEQYNDENANSTAMVITYGNTRFFFGGDTPQEAETDIINAGYDMTDIDVYKVSHHGSTYSTSYAFVHAMSERPADSAGKPFYSIISCGKNNDYGHPHANTIERLEQAGAVVYRTDQCGTLVCMSDGKNVTFLNQENAQGETPACKPAKTPETDTGGYIGNKKSYVVHKDTCRNLPAEKNRIYFPDLGEAIKAGYHKCSYCLK